jgi:hypothetical protein
VYRIRLNTASGKKNDGQSSGCVSKCGYGTKCVTLTSNILKARKKRRVDEYKINAVGGTVVWRNADVPKEVKMV